MMGVVAQPRRPTGSALQTWLVQNRELAAIVVILIALFVLSSLLSDRFITQRNLNNIGTNAVSLALIGVGQTFVILTGGIDLSVGSVVTLSTVVATRSMEKYPELAVPISIGVLLMGTVVGLVNGLLITRLRIPAFLVTLGTLSIVQGIVFVIARTQGGSIPSWFEVFAFGTIGPLPVGLFLGVIVVVVAIFVLANTPFGRYIYAVGGNAEGARLSGIPVDRVVLGTYVLSGFLASMSGLFITSRVGIGIPTIGQGMELDSVTAVVIGGTNLFGGQGGLIGTVIGVVILRTIDNILNLIQVSPFWQQVLKGLIIVLAVAIYVPRRVRRSL
jgi:ribose transport system permease protein